MTIWHVLLYSAAAVLALRSFVQLITNYRNDFEHTAVKEQLARMAEELEAETQKVELQIRPEADEDDADFGDKAAPEPQATAS